MYPYVLLGLGLLAAGYVVFSFAAELEACIDEKKRKSKINNRESQHVCEECEDTVSNIFYRSGKYVCNYCRSNNIPCKSCKNPAEKFLNCKHKFYCKGCMIKKFYSEQCANQNCVLWDSRNEKPVLSPICKSCTTRRAVEFKDCKHKYFCDYCFRHYYKSQQCPEEECRYLKKIW